MKRFLSQFLSMVLLLLTGTQAMALYKYTFFDDKKQIAHPQKKNAKIRCGSRDYQILGTQHLTKKNPWGIVDPVSSGNSMYKLCLTTINLAQDVDLTPLVVKDEEILTRVKNFEGSVIDVVRNIGSNILTDEQFKLQVREAVRENLRDVVREVVAEELQKLK